MRSARRSVAAAALAAATIAAASADGRPLLAQAASAAAIPPVRPALEAVPLPPLDTFEAAVAEQLRDAQHPLERASSDDAGARDLARGYGALGQAFHAYELFDSAEPAYRNAVRLAPADIAWRHLLGYLYEQTGRLAEAADQFATIQRMRPGHREAAVHLGEVYLRLNRVRDAREQFETVLGTFPAVAHHGLGQIALREGRFREAIAHFEQVLDRLPQATAVHYPLAMAYRGLGRIDDARAHLERQGAGGVRAADAVVDGLQALVRGERALVMQGRRAYEAGQLDAAADAFRRAVSAAPGSATARANLGLTLSRLGDSGAAAGEFDAALRLDPANLAARTGLGLLLVEQRRDADAAAHLRAAFEQAPDDPIVSRELLGVLLRLGLGDEAIALLERIRSVDPDDEGVLIGLSILLADRERFAQAIALLGDANRRFPERTATATTLARLLASAPELSVREGGRALELAASVYASAPIPAHAETVAMALAEIGRCDEAADWIRRALAQAEADPDTKEAERLRAEAPKYSTAPCAAAGK